MLNISYNTSRLQRIIDDFLERKEYVSKRKAKNRGKAATKEEIAETITEFLKGESVAEIAKSLYRSSGFVKSIIQKAGVPKKDDNGIVYLPEECVSENFQVGETVWSAKYHCTAIIKNEMSIDYQAEKPGYADCNYEEKYSSKCYGIYVIKKISKDSDFIIDIDLGGFNAYAPAYDLGKLTHLEEYGVKLDKL